MKILRSVYVCLIQHISSYQQFLQDIEKSLAVLSSFTCLLAYEDSYKFQLSFVFTYPSAVEIQCPFHAQSSLQFIFFSLSVCRGHPLVFSSLWDSSSSTVVRICHHFLLTATGCFGQSLCASLGSHPGAGDKWLEKGPTFQSEISLNLSVSSAPFCARFPGIKNRVAQQSLPCTEVVRD